ncbi:MAG TPA: hypothetical protein VD862_03460 [Candidatus Paceibacterota bacterium]|nr:hypothetical protein [Candidatus Paceibacterota bacterium]
MKRTHLAYPAAALLLTGLVVAACGKGPNSPSPLPTSGTGLVLPSGQPAEQPTQGTPAAPGTVGGRDGVVVERLSSNFADQRCTELALPQYAGVDVLEEVARITNNTGREGYPKPALFQNPKASCDPWDKNPAGQPVLDKLIIGENIPPGESRVWTHRLELPRDFCGSFQFDNDFRNGEVAVSSFGGGAGGKVINSGRDCPTCEGINGRFEGVNQDGSTVVLTPRFAPDIGGVKVKGVIHWGDGTSEPVTSGTAVQHSYPSQPQKAYHISLVLTAGNLECDPGLDITVGNNPTCEDYEAPAISGDIGVDLTPTQVTFSSGTVAPAGGTFAPALPITYDRPPAGGPAGSFGTTYILSYGPENLECSARKTFVKPIPPLEQTCDESSLEVKVKLIEGGQLVYRVRSSQPGTITIGGRQFNFSEGDTGIVNLGVPACGLTIEWSAQTRCDEESGSVQTDECEERTCEDVDASLYSCSGSSSGASCTASWNPPPGTAGITFKKGDGVLGTWNVSPGGTASYASNLPAGDYSFTLKVQDGELTCKDKYEFSVEETCADIPATSQASQPFELANSSDATETAWVNSNVSPGPYALFSKPGYESGCVNAPSSAKVVLLKAGREYIYFLNVSAGQQLCSANGKDVSHLSLFNCAD